MKQQQDSVLNHLRESARRGLDSTALQQISTKNALEGLRLLWLELRAIERQRDGFLILGWGALVLLQLTACRECDSGPGDIATSFAVCTLLALASPIPLFLLRRRRRALQNCLTLLDRTVAQARRTECVPPLLDLLATPGIKNEGALSNALIRLLPRLTPEEARALTQAQRATLCKVISRRGTDTELIISGLLILAEAQDSTLVSFAQRLYRSHHKEERLKEAAWEYLAARGE